MGCISKNDAGETLVRMLWKTSKKPRLRPTAKPTKATFYQLQKLGRGYKTCMVCFVHQMIVIVSNQLGTQSVTVLVMLRLL